MPVDLQQGPFPIETKQIAMLILPMHPSPIKNLFRPVFEGLLHWDTPFTNGTNSILATPTLQTLPVKAVGAFTNAVHHRFLQGFKTYRTVGGFKPSRCRLLHRKKRRLRSTQATILSQEAID